MQASREERGKSKSRLLKIECEGCGMILRGSAAALRTGLPTCACGEPFIIAAPASLEKVDPDAFGLLIDQSASSRSANAILRTAGFDILPSHGQNRTPQCKARGCKRLRAPLALYCEHCDPDKVPF